MFEAADRLGGSLWRHPEEVLPRSVMGNDFEVVKNLLFDIRFGVRIDIRSSLPDLQQDFAAIFLGTGRDFEPEHRNH